MTEATPLPSVAAPPPAPFRAHFGRLSRNVLVYGVTGALTRTATLLLVPVLTTYLTTAQHGVLSLLALATAMLFPVASVGLGAAAGACYFAGGAAHKAATIWTAFVMILPGAVILLVVAGLFAPSISTALFGGAQFAGPVRISLVSTTCTAVSLPFALYLQFEERSSAYARIMLFSTSVTTMATLGAVMWMHMGLEGVLYGALAGQAVLLVTLLLSVAADLPWHIDRRVLNQLLRVGLPLIPGFGFVLLLHQGNKVLIEWLSGLGPLGVYTLGFNLGFALSIFVAAFQAAWLPFAMSFLDQWEEARVLFGRIMTYYVIGAGLLTIFFFASARFVVLLLAGPAFHQAYEVVGLSAAAQFFVGMFSVVLPAAYFARQVHYVTIVHALSTIIMAAASVVLIPPFGIMGAGLALVIGAASSPPLQHLWNVSRGSRYLQVVYQWNRTLLALVIYAVIAAVSLWPRSLSVSVELLFASLLVAMATIAAYGLLTGPERAALRGLALKWLPLSKEAAA